MPLFFHCNENNVYTRVQKFQHLLQRLFAERTAEVVVQTPLNAVFTKGVTTGSCDWLKKQPFEDREEGKKALMVSSDESCVLFVQLQNVWCFIYMGCVCLALTTDAEREYSENRFSLLYDYSRQGRGRNALLITPAH